MISSRMCELNNGHGQYPHQITINTDEAIFGPNMPKGHHTDQGPKDSSQYDDQGGLLGFASEVIIMFTTQLSEFPCCYFTLY